MIKRLRYIAHFYSESLYFAYQALKLNKVRAFLSLIGITIGIFSIISVFAVLDSLKSSIHSSIESLGNNIVYIQKWPWEFSNDYPWWKYLSRPVVSVEEANEIANRSLKASSVVFMANSVKNVEVNKIEVKDVPIIIADYEFDKVRSFEIDKGRYFTPNESKSGVKKAIIGATLASILFKNESPIGNNIQLMGIKFNVVGVFKKEGNSIFDQSLDNVVLLPLNACHNYFDFRDEMMNPTIIVKAYEGISLDQLSYELKSIMRSIRRIRPADEDNFAINQASAITKGFNDLFGVVDIAGIVIGGFSILVGGFGIANIMFVSVKERTKLIGIQKAIGAKNAFILLQFLNESVLLSLLGGILGLVLVLIAIFYAEKIIDMNLTLSFKNIITGLSISAIIGILSGYAPARVAAKMNPVEAINSNF
ncbi:MAG: ABC transporter permease [Bacteroidales bacterium]|nr:ABC transporter permease [Bacteroidales bacterium]